RHVWLTPYVDSPSGWREAVHRHVSPRIAKQYVWATSTGATVDVDAPSRGATLGAFICGSIFN
ncbi:MAG: hypothetical protein Q8O17_04970, partial [Candidatus Methanoperedens sp.]|nr:hypothetical protein [Candidatus Methanoperedens sp.]